MCETAKIFTNGGSQALRIPKEFRRFFTGRTTASTTMRYPRRSHGPISFTSSTGKERRSVPATIRTAMSLPSSAPAKPMESARETMNKNSPLMPASIARSSSFHSLEELVPERLLSPLQQPWSRKKTLTRLSLPDLLSSSEARISASFPATKSQRCPLISSP